MLSGFQISPCMYAYFGSLLIALRSEASVRVCHDGCQSALQSQPFESPLALLCTIIERMRSVRWVCLGPEESAGPGDLTTPPAACMRVDSAAKSTGNALGGLARRSSDGVVSCLMEHIVHQATGVFKPCQAGMQGMRVRAAQSQDEGIIALPKQLYLGFASSLGITQGDFTDTSLLCVAPRQAFRLWVALAPSPAQHLSTNAASCTASCSGLNIMSSMP